MNESLMVISFILDDLCKNDLITEKQLLATKEMLMNQVQEKNEDAA